MNRREIIKMVALSTGATLSMPLLGSLVTACSEVGKNELANTDLLFFDQSEFDLISTLADLVIPRSDSPSATDVNAHQLVDLMVAKTYRKKDRESYKKSFHELKQYLEANDMFHSRNKQQKTDVLNDLMASSDPKLKQARQSFLSIKQQVIAYYLSSEEVAKNHLNYLPVPGEYQPCISVDEVNNKAWAL